MLYQTLLPLYKEDTFNISSWRQAALENVAAFYTDWLVNAHGKDTTFKISIEELSQKVNTTLDAVTAIATPENTKVTEIIRTLNEYGIKRTEYIHDASSWLLQHVTTSSARLSKIWSDRGRALLEGVSDNPGDIAHWQDQNALRMYLDELQSKQKMPKNLTRAEIITRYRPWADELSRVYPAKIVVEAISKFKEESQDVEKKLLPPRTIQIQRGKDSFKLEVLAQDDPRGLTIGIDTGCCMHYEGASNSCIWSGYVDPGAGFLALYAPDGKLIAQSYFYTNDRHPDTLVLDNIEATQGRDTGAIVSLYIEGLKQYLEWRYASDKDWKIRIVNVGTGYGDAVKKTVTTLPQAKHVPNTPYIYTDAKDQRILLSVSDEEITTWRSEPIPAAAETVKPIHTPELERRNIYHFYRPERVISGLEAQIYPEHIRQYTDPETVEEELKMPKAGQYSSLYFEKIDASEELVAYLIAYEARSESKYRQRKPVLYIADLAILPNSQHKGVGTKMLDDFLSMVTKNGVYKKIEMHARASTSYPALQSESAQTLLKKHGYVFKDHGVVDSFEDDDGQLEKLYLVSLTKIELPPEEIAAQTLIETPTPDLPSLEVNTDQASPEINETDLPSEDEIAAQIEELTTFELPDAE